MVANTIIATLIIMAGIYEVPIMCYALRQGFTLIWPFV